MGWQLSFSQRSKLAQLQELNGVERHRFMKQSAWDHQLDFAAMRRVKAVKTKTSPWKETGLDAIGQFPASAEGKGKYFS
jgi:hypothetical protein